MNVFQYALLLEDVKGLKRNYLGKHAEILVFKGSLLQTLVNHDQMMMPFANPLRNYSILMADISECTSLYCRDDQVQVLSAVQKDLLYGIQDLAGRLGVVDRLHWAESLKIGSVVHVTLSSSNLLRATVQYTYWKSGWDKWSNIWVEVTG